MDFEKKININLFFVIAELNNYTTIAVQNNNENVNQNNI